MFLAIVVLNIFSPKVTAYFAKLDPRRALTHDELTHDVTTVPELTQELCYQQDEAVKRFMVDTGTKNTDSKKSVDSFEFNRRALKQQYALNKRALLAGRTRYLVGRRGLIRRQFKRSKTREKVVETVETVENSDYEHVLDISQGMNHRLFSWLNFKI